MQGNEEAGECEREKVELEWPAGVGVAECSATDKHVQDGKKQSRQSGPRGQRRRITESDQSNSRGEAGERRMELVKGV